MRAAGKVAKFGEIIVHLRRKTTEDMNKTRGLMWAIVSSATFGLIPLFSLPVLLDGMGLDSVCFYRFGFSTVGMGLYMLLRRRSLRISAREFVMVFLLSIFYAATSMCLTSSYVYIPSGMATTIHFLYPILVTSIMILMFGERASWQVLVAAALALAGVYLLCGSGVSSGNIAWRGVAAVLVTVVTYATYIVGVNRLPVRNMDGAKMTFYVLLSSAVIFYLNLLFRHGGHVDPIPDTEALRRLLLLALLPTLISDLTLIYAIQSVGSTITAILGCMEPLTAVLMGMIFFYERFVPLQVLGIAAILLAVILVILSDGSGRRYVNHLLWLRRRHSHCRS